MHVYQDPVSLVLMPNLDVCRSACDFFFLVKKVIRDSAKLIHEKIQGSVLQKLPKMYHGEFSINYVNDYVNWIIQIVKQK